MHDFTLFVLDVQFPFLTPLSLSSNFCREMYTSSYATNCIMSYITIFQLSNSLSHMGLKYLRGKKNRTQYLKRLRNWVLGGAAASTSKFWSFFTFGKPHNTKSSVFFNIVQTAFVTLYTCTALQRAFEQY